MVPFLSIMKNVFQSPAALRQPGLSQALVVLALEPERPATAGRGLHWWDGELQPFLEEAPAACGGPPGEPCVLPAAGQPCPCLQP